MPDISEVVSVTITADTTTPTQVGFGTPLLLTYHTKFAPRIKKYSNLTGLTADGFLTTDPTYLMALSLLSQDPRVKEFKVGRAATSVVPVFTLEVTTAVEAQIISATLVSPAGVETLITRTVPAASSLNAEADAFAALIDVLADIAAPNPAAAVITCTGGTVGTRWHVKEWKNLKYQDTTADVNYSTDLAAIVLEDNDWYGLAIEIPSEINIDEVAAWIETQKKIFIANTGDDLELEAGGSIGSGLKAASYKRTALLFSKDLISYAGAAWIGKQLPKAPGSSTWAHKTLVGVVPDIMTTSQQGFLDGDNINHYQTISGINVTRKGYMASGQFIDTTIAIDWLTARIQERVFDLLTSVEKVDYTDEGVSQVVAEIKAQLRQAIDARVLAAEPVPSVSAPLVADIPTADRTNRHLPDIFFTGRLAGAVHTVDIEGTLSV